MNRIWIFLLLICSFVACDKTAYKLEGKWKMEQIQYADGRVEAIDTVFYNFQNTLFSYQWYSSTTNSYPQYSGFLKMLDDVTMELELAKSGEMPISDNKIPTLIGWTERTKIFTIEKLTRTKLILNSDGETYTFHSF